MLVVNGVSDAFWMGSLRHRNLDGAVVDSEPFEETESEEVPVEESSDMEESGSGVESDSGGEDDDSDASDSTATG